MTPLARGILSSAKLGVANFAKYFMSKFDSPYGVEVPDDNTLDLTDDFSGCAFVYPHNRDMAQRVMSKYSQVGNQRSWWMAILGSGKLFMGHSVDGSATTFFTSTIDIPLDTFTLVHFRLTGGSLYLGINGTTEQSVARGACFSSSAPIEIGKFDGVADSDDFDITQPMLFNSGSSLANFATIYNGGMPCKYSLITTSITDDAVMAFELSSNDTTVTDLSTDGNDGAFVGGSFVDGHLVTWKIGPEATFPITPAYYRIHENFAPNPPSVVISNSTTLTVVSTVASIDETIILFHVTKDEIDGKKIYIDWNMTFKSSLDITRRLALYDGFIKGDDAQWVNNSNIPAAGADLVTHAGSDSGVIQESILVPSLAGFGNSITLMVEFRDSWSADALTGTLTGLELRETNENLIGNFDFLGTISETGTDGGSSFGQIAEA